MYIYVVCSHNFMYIRTYIHTLPSQTSYVDLITIINFSHIRKYTLGTNRWERLCTHYTTVHTQSPQEVKSSGPGEPTAQLHMRTQSPWRGCMRTPRGLPLVVCPSWSAPRGLPLVVCPSWSAPRGLPLMVLPWYSCTCTRPAQSASSLWWCWSHQRPVYVRMYVHTYVCMYVADTDVHMW